MTRKNQRGNVLIGFLFIIILVLLGARLLHLQDKQYERYSEQAKKLCASDETKSLLFDDDLKYWKCITN